MLYETQFRQAINYESEHEELPDIQALGTNFDVRRITENDITDVYRLCKTNKHYYRYMHAVPTRESLTAIISDVPGDADKNNKYFVGFYQDEKLIAVLDLILGTPASDNAFIGWLMVDGECQHQGIGSQIVADVRAAVQGWGYKKLSLACVTANEEAIAFWEGQGFVSTGEEEQQGRHTVRTYQKEV